MKRGRKAKDVDDYISWYPGEVGKRLEKIRRTVRKVSKASAEKISYDIPTIIVDGRPMLYFAAFADHLSVYPAPRGASEFADELKQYAGGKGTLQLPHDQPVPYDLIERIARHHLARIEGARKPAAKKSAKKVAARKSATKKSPAKKPGPKKSAPKPNAQRPTPR